MKLPRLSATSRFVGPDHPGGSYNPHGSAHQGGIQPADDFCQCCGQNRNCRFGCKCDCESGQICESS